MFRMRVEVMHHVSHPRVSNTAAQLMRRLRLGLEGAEPVVERKRLERDGA